jgi:Kef-type K+ transport system membrane component KefB
MKNKSLVYFSIISIFGLSLWLVLRQSPLLESGKYAPNAPLDETQKQLLPPKLLTTPPSIWHDFQEHIHHPLAILLLQILTIIISARLLAWLMVKIGQPTVIGEIAAGILLGPSLVGTLFPNFSAFLFPTASLGNLQFLSQVGLILFMFIIGMELDLSALRRTARDAIVISHSGIIINYFLGASLAAWLYRDFAPDSISFLSFALFMGIAMSITAFPVLARIVQERGLTKHPIGTMVIACAASDDVTAWCLLAIVIAIAKAGSIGGALMTILFSSLYVLFMLYAVKPLLERVAYRNFARETVNKGIIALIFSIMLLSAYAAEVIGIHALFGAFMAGVIIPANPEFRHVLANKIEDVSLVLLLPLFFVITGLRTQIGLLNEANLWLVCGLVILTAVVGKFCGTAFAARLVGQSWKNALTIGALMNTRGLMELVVLNIGYDLGILSPSVFAMMVLMALSTTFMTGPALNIINFFYRKTPDLPTTSPAKLSDAFKLLISFGQPKAGSRLLQLVDELNWTSHKPLTINALHLTPSADISIKEAAIFEKEGFEPILETAAERQITLETHYKATNNLNYEIINFANEGHFDLMLVGRSRPLFSNDETGGKVQDFFSEVTCPLGVMIDKGFTHIQHILLVLDSSSDLFLFDYLQKLDRAKTLTVLDNFKILKNHQQTTPATIKVLEKTDLDSVLLANNSEVSDKKGFDLILVSRQYWQVLRQDKQAWMDNSPTILILNKSFNQP